VRTVRAPARGCHGPGNAQGRSRRRPVRFYEGDLLRDPLPPGYDAVLLANVVHVFTPENNRGLLERVHASALPGARLLLVDFWTNSTHTHPVFAALMAGNG